MNPHRVSIYQTTLGSYRAECAGCEWVHQSPTHGDAKVRGVTHQMAHASDHDIWRRTDWTEPMEDT